MAVLLTKAIELRDEALRSYQSALSSASYTIGNRALTRQKLAELKREWVYWDNYVAVLQATGRPPAQRWAKRVIERDL